MKKRSMITVLVLTFLLFISCFSSVFAEPYDYTVTIYAGKQGAFSDGSKVKTVTVSQGEDVDIAKLAAEKGFKVTNNEYYCRGFRETGHDNDESPSLVAFKADEDVSYEAAYGIKGGMVKYIVQYVDADGNALAGSDEYYGMVGDKPVVSYHYIDGYQPKAYNLTKTLKADESQNVFKFSYVKNAANGNAGNTGNNGQAGAGNAGGQNNGNGNANGNTGTNANAGADDANGNTPAQLTDLDDNAVPQADNPGTESDITDSDSSGAGISPAAICGAVAAVAVIAGLIAFLIKRRTEYEEEEE